MNVALAVVCVGLCAVLVWARRSIQAAQRQNHSLSEKLTEIELHAREQVQVDARYRMLFENDPVGIIVSQLDGTLIDVNAATVRTFGYSSREEFMTINVRSLYVNPAERDRRITSALNATEMKPREHRLRRKDGTTFPGLVQFHVSRDAQGKPDHVDGFITDISDYKRLEEDRETLEHEQRISTRLQSVGALAAGIAHEINTPMQFVSDSVYFLKTAISELNVLWPELARLGKESPIAGGSAAAIVRIEAAMSQIDVEHLVVDANESVERALDGIRRVTKIIRAMREFAHPDNGEHSKVNINDAIETTMTVCRNIYKEIADTETDFGDLPLVMCQFGEMNQVFLNILVNATHAIEAQKLDCKGLIRIVTCVEDDWAVIRISDNGTGIPDSVKARIFDPFFTTKEVGKGTGQGLAIVQSVIVERHRGRITVESEMGKGTTFILRLPIEQPDSSVTEVLYEQET